MREAETFENKKVRGGLDAKKVFFGLLIFSIAGLGVVSTSLFGDQQDSLKLQGGRNFGSSQKGKMADSLKPSLPSKEIQEIRMTVRGNTYYPYPIIVKKGVPVKIIGELSEIPGCSRSIVIPEFNIRKTLRPGDNVIEFLPTREGSFRFACSMGMYFGQIIVTDAENPTTDQAIQDPSAVLPEKQSGSACGVGSCGCNCGS
ncbi:MAG: cupredoxin domain-containing protein [Candidatus Anstonellaceae archaeon]